MTFDANQMFFADICTCSSQTTYQLIASRGLCMTAQFLDKLVRTLISLGLHHIYAPRDPVQRCYFIALFAL